MFQLCEPLRREVRAGSQCVLFALLVDVLDHFQAEKSAGVSRRCEALALVVVDNLARRVVARKPGVEFFPAGRNHLHKVDAGFDLFHAGQA